MNIIKATNLTKIYSSGEAEQVYALNDVSLELNKGDFACILGRSGSGKSTLLNLLAILDKPSSGLIFFKDIDITKASEGKLNELRRSYFSIIFQFHHLLPYFTAIENVLLPFMHSMKSVSAEHKALAKKSLENVGLAGKENRLPGQLSGGEQQRVAIARALCTSPEILFADEPTGSLDSETGNSIIELLKTLNKNGLTIAMVTHQQDYATAANKVFRMENGKIL